MPMKTKASLDALLALRQEFPDGIPEVRSLSKEQKAWLHITMQSLSFGIKPPNVYAQLQKICNRLLHATEDVPDKELQKMVSFVFENMTEIKKMLEREQD